MRRLATTALLATVALVVVLGAIVLGTRSPRPAMASAVHAPSSSAFAPLPPPSVVGAGASRGIVVEPDRRQGVRPGARPSNEGPSPGGAAGTNFDAPGHLDPKYIHDRIEKAYMPLALDCFREASEKKPDLHVKVVLRFRIVGDDKVGGIVEGVELTAGPARAVTLSEAKGPQQSGEFGQATDVDDPAFLDCIRESLLGTTFEAPEGGGTVDVSYPLEISVYDPDEDDGAADPSDDDASEVP